MEMFISAILIMELSMVKVSTNGKMVVLMKDNFIKVKDKEEVHGKEQMVTFSKASIIMT